MINETHGVLWGADYYPEQWDPSYYEEDARRMKEFGIRAVRLMEFAWTMIEPEKGRYDFSFFDNIINILSKEGIKVILGTPTATFPVWLYEKDPHMVQIHPSGIERGFGTRRQGCFNSDTYREASIKIAEACGEHFGRNSNVIGWQIDNEIGHEGSDRCICGNCRKKWYKFLEDKYQNIDNLNKTWGTVFWGTTYERFDQIPVPKTEVSSIQNPNLILDYYRFSSASAVSYVNAQIEALKKHISPEQFITTNLYPAPHYPVIDMEKLTDKMDFASFDNYPIWGEQDEPLPYLFNSYVLSYIRGLNNRGNFAVMEQFSGIQGNVCLGALPPENQVTLWTNQAVALGANKILYFRWRTAEFGQEQLCYGIFDADNTENGRSKAIRDNIKKWSSDFEQFADVPVKFDACVLYDKDNARLLKDQYLSKGLFYKPSPYMQVGYDVELAKNYAPYVLFNINADVKSVSNVNLEDYRIISLPLYEMADKEFVKKLEKWVEAGGILILGFRAGTKDINNHSVRELLPGSFSRLAGIKIRKFESLNETSVKMKLGPIPCKGQAWADIVECTTAQPIAYYSDKKKHYRGAPSITMNNYGKGKVFYLGTSPELVSIFFVYRKIFKLAGLKPKFYGQGIEVIKRKTKSGKDIEIVLNHTAKGKRIKGKYIKPYDMEIIQ